MSIDFNYVLFFFVTTFAMINHNLYAQWSKESDYNKKLILDCVNPTDISVSADNSGGTFIVWSDKKKEEYTNSFIQYVTVAGEPNFRADGKKLSSLKSDNILPVLSNQYDNSVVVCWLEKYYETKTALKVQRIQKNGFFHWDENGLQVTDGANEIKDFKIVTDESGTSFILFIEKDLITKKYYLKLQKISPAGYIEFSYRGLVIASSEESISTPQIFYSAKNGIYIFWTEDLIGKAISYFTFVPIDEFNPSTIGKKKIFEMNSNLISVNIFQTGKSEFSVLIHDRGKTKKYFSFKIEKYSVVKEDFLSDFFNSKQNPANIQLFTIDNEYAFLVWLETKLESKNIFARLIHLSGQPVWNQDLQVHAADEEQVSYSAFTDKSGELKISWIQKPLKKRGNIFAQFITSKGEMIYSPQPVILTDFNQSEKSYLQNYSDSDNGMVIVFKEKIGNEVSIYQHRIYSPSNLSISDFSCSQAEEKINIYFTNITSEKTFTYILQRGSEVEPNDTLWQPIKTFAIVPGKKNFQFVDLPDSSDVYFYRVQQVDDKNQKIYSSVIAINYLNSDESSYKLFDNVPNPFFGETTISFYIPQAAEVKLMIYNSKLETIVDTTLVYDSRGKKNFSFSGYGHTPGVYFYRIVMGTLVEVKKMVLVK